MFIKAPRCLGKRKENKSYSDGTEGKDDAAKRRHQVAPALTQVTIHAACQLRNYVVLDEISFPFFFRIVSNFAHKVRLR